jgi:hypothetical protein
MTGCHLDDDLLDDYADGVPLSPALQASAEKHLEACGLCRGRLVPAVDPARLDAVWAEVVATVDAPPLGLVARALLRLGVREDTARLLAVTPSMRVPWLLSLAAVLGLALLTAHTVDSGVVLFLALAPVLPVAGVAVAFSPATDPVHELATAAPYDPFRLLVLRSTAVVAVTVLLAAALALLLPGTPSLAAAWLLPALALTATTLALSTWFEPLRTAAGLTVAWLSLALSGLLPGHDPLLVVRAGVQLTCLVLLVAAVTVVALRRDDPHLLGSPS